MVLGFYLIKKINKKRENYFKFNYFTQSKNKQSVIKNNKQSANQFFLLKTLKNQKLYSIFNLIILVLLLIIHFSFGFFHLNKSSYVDEKLWTYGEEHRIEKFYPNILERDWKHTRPSDKPGVSLAIISGIGLLWTTPSDFYHNFADKKALMEMLSIMRLPLLIFSTLALIFFYHLIGRLFNPAISLLTLTMIALSPILLGISRLINPDALSWIFMPLTLLAYFLYLKNKQINRKWLYWTGIFLGVSLLTKYIANLIIIFLFLEIFVEAVFLKIQSAKLKSFLRNKFVDFLIIIFIALVVFYILFPGVWVKPDRLLIGTIFSQAFLPIWKYFLAFILFLVIDNLFWCSKIFSFFIQQFQKISRFLYLILPILFLVGFAFVLLNMYLANPIVDFETMVAAPKTNNLYSLPSLFLSGFYSTIFSLSPIVLIGLISGLFFSSSTISKSGDKFSKLIIWNFFFFILLYYLGSTVSLVASSVRYQIILYPLFFIISGYGWYQLLNKFCKKSWGYFILLFLLIAISTYSLWVIKPYYFVYSNILLPEKYTVNPKDMGDGSYEAAQFLNSLPEAENLKIWSDRNGVCVVFNGYCNHSPHLKGFTENGTDYDYYVISRASQSRIQRLTDGRVDNIPTYPLRLDRLYQSDDYIFNLEPSNRSAHYVRIIPKDAVIVFEGEN
jgi:4-amino-4-deoxy-L-arabinose transferase-like glycosyltransferase